MDGSSATLVSGLGMSMLNMPATVLLGFYFRRRRSLANSITKCGVGVGAVAFPPIVTYLLNQYGLRGALLLMGGVCLNTLVAAMLFRPTSFYKKRKRLRSEAAEQANSQIVEVKRSDCNVVVTETDMAENRNKGEQDKDTIENGELLENFTQAAHTQNTEPLDGTPVGCEIIIEEVDVSFAKHNGDGGKTMTGLAVPAYDVGVLSRSTPELTKDRVVPAQCRRRTRTVSEHADYGVPMNSRCVFLVLLLCASQSLAKRMLARIARH